MQKKSFRFRVGDPVVVVNGGMYLHTKDGSEGIITEVDTHACFVDFYKITGVEVPRHMTSTFYITNCDLKLHELTETPLWKALS